MSAPELNNKIQISLAAIVMLVTVAFSLGGIWISVMGLDTKLIDEVGGLRSDMNREIKLLREEVQKEDVYIRSEIKDVREDGLTRQSWINSRTDRKIINHEKIYHNKK